MLTVTILFLAILFIIGLMITTLLSFPTKKFQEWFQSISAKAPIVHEKSITTSSSSTTMARKKVKSSNNYNKLELKQIFATFDKNNDGYITKKELKQSLKNIGILMDDTDIADMVEKVDSNKDGLIDLDEFYELCHYFLGIEAVNEEHGGETLNQEEVANREKDLKEAFDVFDYDKDGLISEEELSKILSSLGLKQGKKLDHCKEMIKKVDVDGDGMVNFDEFKKLMKAGGTFT